MDAAVKNYVLQQFAELQLDLLHGLHNQVCLAIILAHNQYIRYHQHPKLDNLHHS